MAYSQGQTIAAADYNGLVSSGASNIGNVWGAGRQTFGWGQNTSLINTVSSATTITAAQWAGLVYNLNKAIGHIWGSGNQLAGGGNIGITAGATIAAFANVDTMTSNIATNRLLFNASGTTVTGTNFTASQSYADSTTGKQTTITRVVTFASGGDAARYFFNAGGILRFFVSGVSNNGTSRSTDYVTLFGTNLRGANVRAITNGGRVGTSGTENSTNTAAGYYALTSTDTTFANISSSSATYTYNTSFVRLNVKSNGTQGSFGDQGSTITFTLVAQQPAQTNSNFNDAVDVTVTTRVDIIPPSTTFIGNVWGVIGVT